jgi:hypothetical protein
VQFRGVCITITSTSRSLAPRAAYAVVAALEPHTEPALLGRCMLLTAGNNSFSLCTNCSVSAAHFLSQSGTSGLAATSPRPSALPRRPAACRAACTKAQQNPTSQRPHQLHQDTPRQHCQNHVIDRHHTLCDAWQVLGASTGCCCLGAAQCRTGAVRRLPASASLTLSSSVSASLLHLSSATCLSRKVCCSSITWTHPGTNHRLIHAHTHRYTRCPACCADTRPGRAGQKCVLVHGAGLSQLLLLPVPCLPNVQSGRPRPAADTAMDMFHLPTIPLLGCFLLMD